MKGFGKLLSVLAFSTAVLVGIATSVAVAQVYVLVSESWTGKIKSEALPSMNSNVFTPPSVDETNPDAFDPEGIYKTDDSKEIKGFSIENKILNVDCDDSRFGALKDATLFLVTGDEKLFDADMLSLSNGKLDFKTEEMSGTRYEFSGRFLVNGNFYTLDPEREVVSGTLTKYVDGKKVSETELSFTWSIDLSCVC